MYASVRNATKARKHIQHAGSGPLHGGAGFKLPLVAMMTWQQDFLLAVVSWWRVGRRQGNLQLCE